MGTWQSSDDEVYQAVLTALKTGYTHIDTAAAYNNEDAIGRAVKDSGIDRSKLFITTKLWCTKHRNPAAALDESLKRLGMEYVDLYLMHWPVPLNPNGNDPKFPKLPDGKRDIDNDWDYIKTWEAMQGLDKLKAKAIGVSNFSAQRIRDLLAAPSTKTVPAANQVELHPLLPQKDLLDECAKHKILVEAYSPLGSTDSPILSDQDVVAIAEKHKVSPATILISWALWRGTVVLPKSVTPHRIESNFEVVELLDDEGNALEQVHQRQGVKRLIDPDWSPLQVF